MTETISVIIISYNQETTIEKAIDSVLEQKVDCNLEILVGDDASTDFTAKLIKKYLGKINFICREKNIGASANLSSLIALAKGEYIAILEGDDYWLDDKKLQIQINFLRSNKNYVGCGTDLFSEERNNQLPWISKKRDYEFKKFDGNILCCQNSTLLFRNILTKKELLYLTLANRNISDRTLQMLLTTKGKIYRLEKQSVFYNFNNTNSVTAFLYSKPDKYLMDYRITNVLEQIASDITGKNIRYLFFKQVLLGTVFLKSIVLIKDRDHFIILKRMLKEENNKLYYIIFLPLFSIFAIIRKIMRKIFK